MLKWASAVPDDFRFCVKTPQGITHHSTLVGAVRPMAQFLDVVRHFGPKLAVVLLQFPPSLTANEFPSLEHFLRQLPTDLRYAVEFRNPTWRTPRTADLLRSCQCAWVAQDYPGQPADVHATADILYVRLIGQHDRFKQYGREQHDTTASLQRWKQKIESTHAQRVFALISDDYAGYAIATANRLKRILGLPLTPLPHDQPTLFG